jgi:hypothetical protein
MELINDTIKSILSINEFNTWKFMMLNFQGVEVSYLDWIIIQIKRYISLKRMFSK